jgi:hypothetical protein
VFRLIQIFQMNRFQVKRPVVWVGHRIECPINDLGGFSLNNYPMMHHMANSPYMQQMHHMPHNIVVHPVDHCVVESLMALVGKVVILETTRGRLDGCVVAVKHDHVVLEERNKKFLVRIAEIVWIMPD